MLQKHPKPHPQTAGRVIDGEAVLILSDDSETMVLNGVGSRIFELAKGELTIETIATMIADEYDVDPTTAQDDVINFIQSLVSQNVLILEEQEA